VTTNQARQLDALGDATRRAIVNRLLKGPASVGKLAHAFPISRPAISQHLKVLKDAKLVFDRAEGTRRVYALNREGFDSLRAYLDQFWTQALAAFQRKVEECMVVEAVLKSVVVKASVERAFQVFTEDFDSWWPRTHHIGNSRMKRAVIECRAGGRCYSEQEDGPDCPWGTVLIWEPPVSLVLAWQVTKDWKYEPELDRSSEVEVRFTAEGDGTTTRVDLEHRRFERHGDVEPMRTMVASPGGWSGTLQLYRERAEAVCLGWAGLTEKPANHF
jgi:DNA-binding transcriptional ArsR family regulator